MVAPILYVMHDEAEAFWCFASLMRKLEANFHTDCRGMQSQLMALSNLMAILDPQLTSFLVCPTSYFHSQPNRSSEHCSDPWV